MFLSGSHKPAEELSAEIAEKYSQNGVDTLAVNYRGFGASDGEPTEDGLYQDAKAMLHYLVHEEKIMPEKIV